MTGDRAVMYIGAPRSSGHVYRGTQFAPLSTIFRLNYVIVMVWYFFFFILLLNV